MGPRASILGSGRSHLRPRPTQGSAHMLVLTRRSCSSCEPSSQRLPWRRPALAAVGLLWLVAAVGATAGATPLALAVVAPPPGRRSDEHTSALQSRVDLVCRLLLEKKNGAVLMRVAGLLQIARAVDIE